MLRGGEGGDCIEGLPEGGDLSRGEDVLQVVTDADVEDDGADGEADGAAEDAGLIYDAER